MRRLSAWLTQCKDFIQVCCLSGGQGDILGVAFKTKACSNVIFFFLNDTFPPPHLPPSLPFGHIAYKSQAILVSGLQKAWPPGKACRTAVNLPDQKLWNSSLCICVWASSFFLHPFMHSSVLFLCSYTAQEQALLCTSFLRMLAVAFVDLPTNHSAFPALIYILVYIHTWAW